MAGAKPLLPVTFESAATVSVACASCGFVPCDELTSPAPIVLMKTPAPADATSTCTVHWPGVAPTAAGTLPPASEKLAEPGVAVTMPPAHVVDALGVAATTTVPGSASVNAAPVAAVALLLIRMTVSVEVCPAETFVGLNVLLTPIDANAATGVTSNAVASAAQRRARARASAGAFTVADLPSSCPPPVF